MDVIVLSATHHTSIFVEPAKIYADLNDDNEDCTDNDDDDFNFLCREFKQEQVNTVQYNTEKAISQKIYFLKIFLSSKKEERCFKTHAKG